MLLASLNTMSLMIALPVIFRGIRLDPLEPQNFPYLLWILMGYMLVMAVVVVTVGRIGDMFGRVRMYNLGFAWFTLLAIPLSLAWSHGPAGALELIVLRMLQAIGGALLMANSAAIITDAFPAEQLGLALGTNMVAMIVGSFLGIIAGGLLSEVSWRWVFLVNVPIGTFATVWAYFKLKEIGIRIPAKIDWLGNVSFAAGLAMILVGITYSLEPYKHALTGWGSPFVLSMISGGVMLLVVFLLVEAKVAAPMFRLSLFRIRPFWAGNVAQLLSAIGRGGFQFMLMIWFQGIWLPQHGDSFYVHEDEETLAQRAALAALSGAAAPGGPEPATPAARDAREVAAARAASLGSDSTSESLGTTPEVGRRSATRASHRSSARARSQP